MMKKPEVFSARRNVVPAVSQRLASFLIATLIALAIVPTLTLAETFTLPSKEVYLGSWDLRYDDYDYGGITIGKNKWHGEAHYNIQDHIYYRVLIDADGKESPIDEYYFDGHAYTGYQTIQPGVATHFWTTKTVPEKSIELSEPGDYRIELRYITIPAPTSDRYSDLKHDSVVDIWEGVRITYDKYLWSYHGEWCSYTSPEEYAQTGTFTGYDTGWSGSCPANTYRADKLGCRYQYSVGHSAGSTANCWVENKTQSSLILSDRAQVLEYYEITVAGPIIPPPSSPDFNSPKLPEKSSFTIQTTDSPFNSNRGDEDVPSSAAPNQMAFAGLLGLTAIGAGAYLYRSYTTSSGSTFRAYKTAAGRAMESAWAWEKRRIEDIKAAYAAWYAAAQRKKRLAAFTAAQQARVESLEAELAAVEKTQFLDDKARRLARIEEKYSDLLSKEGKAQIKQAADTYGKAWAAGYNAEAMRRAQAIHAPAVLANQVDFDPMKMQESKKVEIDAMNFEQEKKPPAQIVGELFAAQRTAYDAYAENRKERTIIDDGIDWLQRKIDQTYGFLSAGKDFAVDSINMLGEVLFNPVETFSGIASGVSYTFAHPRETIDSIKNSLIRRYTEGADSGHPGIGEGKGAFDIAALIVPIGVGGRTLKGARSTKDLNILIKTGRSLKNPFLKRLGPDDIAKLSVEQRTAYSSIMNEISAAEKNLAKANKAMFGEAKHSVDSIGFVNNRFLGWNAANIGKHVDFNLFERSVTLLKKKIDYELLVNHEFGHEITREFWGVVGKNIKGTPFKKGFAMNEAHDLMTLELWKKFNPQKYPQAKNAYINNVFERSGAIQDIESIVKNADINKLKSFTFSMDLKAEGPFVAEWMSVSENAVKNMNVLETMAVESGSKNLVKTIKDISTLKEAYAETLIEVFGK